MFVVNQAIFLVVNSTTKSLFLGNMLIASADSINKEIRNTGTEAINGFYRKVKIDSTGLRKMFRRDENLLFFDSKNLQFNELCNNVNCVGGEKHKII